MISFRLFLPSACGTLLAGCVISMPGTPPQGSVPVAQTVPVVAVAVPYQTAKSGENSMYVCTLRAFTSHYRAEDSNRGRARLNVKRQCTDEFDEMFCQDKDIRCTEYK